MSEIDNLLNSYLNSAKEDAVKLSLEDIERESRAVELDLRREELISNRQDREERKKFAKKIFQMLGLFLMVILIIVVCCAINCLSFYLSDTVIIALLTTTTVNVIGIFLVVVKYLFRTIPK